MISNKGKARLAAVWGSGGLREAFTVGTLPTVHASRGWHSHPDGDAVQTSARTLYGSLRNCGRTTIYRGRAGMKNTA